MPFCLVYVIFFISTLVVVQEDPVLLVPEEKEQKPYVAIIKVHVM